MVAQLMQQYGPDEDGDGFPDRLAQMLRDDGFSISNDNWKHRRRIIYVIAGTAWGMCLAMGFIWAWMVLIRETDIPPNLLNFGTTMFWANNVMASTLILGYVGVSQVDRNSYRKHSADMAKAIPSPPMYNVGDYYTGGSRYHGDRQRYSDYYDIGAGGAQQSTDTNSVQPPTPVAPPTPIAPQDGPQRKPGVIL